jgi:hypothetical protein
VYNKRKRTGATDGVNLSPQCHFLVSSVALRKALISSGVSMVGTNVFEVVEYL